MLIPIIAVLMTIIILLVFARHTHLHTSDAKMVQPILNPIEEVNTQKEGSSDIML